MYYTNSMTITLKNNTSANKALEILRSRLSAGFAADNSYGRNPSQIMGEALEVIDNTIVLPEDFGCYITEDAESVMLELIQNLAENMGSESFDWDGWDSNDYTDGHFEAAYRNGLLSIKYTAVCIPLFRKGRNFIMFCPKCSAEISTQDQFCRCCGNKFSKEYEQFRSSSETSHTSIIFLAIGAAIAILDFQKFLSDIAQRYETE